MEHFLPDNWVEEARIANSLEQFKFVVDGLHPRLFRFRPLGSDRDRIRLLKSLRHGKLWSSRIWSQNDPMEGIYSRGLIGEDDIHSRVNRYFRERDSIFDYKSRKVICSFLGYNGLTDVLTWSHYTNGFRGVAIEFVPLQLEKVFLVTYYDEIINLNRNIENESLLNLITRKSKHWAYENEFRFIDDSDEGYVCSGKVDAVYVGLPLIELNNHDQIVRNHVSWRSYYQRIKLIIDFCDKKSIPLYKVVPSYRRVHLSALGLDDRRTIKRVLL